MTVMNFLNRTYAQGYRLMKKHGTRQIDFDVPIDIRAVEKELDRIGLAHLSEAVDRIEAVTECMGPTIKRRVLIVNLLQYKAEALIRRVRTDDARRALEFHFIQLVPWAGVAARMNCKTSDAYALGQRGINEIIEKKMKRFENSSSI